MAIDEVVRINNIIYAWDSTLFQVAGRPVLGFLDVQKKEKREGKIVYGSTQDGKPLGITEGQYRVEGLTWKLLYASWDAVSTHLASLAGSPSFGDFRFPFTIQVSEPRIFASTITSTISGCKIAGVSEPFAVGIDELAVEVELQAQFATTNGKQLWTAKQVPQ